MDRDFLEGQGENHDLDTIELIKADFKLDTLEMSYPALAFTGRKKTPTALYIYKFYPVHPYHDGLFLFCELYQQLSSFETRPLASVTLARQNGQDSYKLHFINEIVRFMLKTETITDIKQWLNELVEITDELTGRDYQPAKKRA